MHNYWQPALPFADNAMIIRLLFSSRAIFPGEVNCCRGVVHTRLADGFSPRSSNVQFQSLVPDSLNLLILTYGS